MFRSALDRLGARCALLALAIVCSASGEANAQSGSGAPSGVDQLFGWVRPQESDQPSKLATARIDLSGGADRDSERADQGELPRDDFASTLATTGRFWSGRADQFIELSGAAWGTYQRLAEDTLTGAEANAQIAREIGRRMGFSVAATGAYRPSLAFGASSPAPDVEPVVAQVTHPQGVVTERWLVVEGTTGLFRDWTSRQRMNVELNVNRQRPSDDVGLRSSSAALQARHEWAFRERAALLLSYRFSENRQSGTVAARPIRLQAATVGIRVERRVSPSRSLSLTVASGPTVVSLPADGVIPPFQTTAFSGWGTLQWSLSQNWALTGEAARYVGALDGLTPEPFITDTGTLTFGGTLGERCSVALVGVASSGAALTASPASFEARSATSQVQYAIARRWVLFGSYSYYQHQLNELVGLSEAYPRNYGRHSVRVGLSLGIPLYRGR